MQPSKNTQQQSQAIHRASSNPERLNSIVKIVSPPTLLFSFISLGSVVGLVLWSFIGSLPRAVNVDGLFVPPDTLSEIQATSDGYIFFEDDLKLSVSRPLVNYGSTLLQTAPISSNSQNQNAILWPSSNYLLSYISFYSNITNNVLGSPSSILMPGSQTEINNTLLTSDNKIKAGKPFAFIFDPNISANLKQAADRYTLSSQISTTQANLTSEISESSLAIYSKLQAQLEELIRLAKIGVVPKTDVLSAQQKLLSAKQDAGNQKIQLQKSLSQLQQNLVALLTGISTTSQSIFIAQPEDGYLIAKVVRSGNKVLANQTIAFTSDVSSTKTIPIITIFVKPSDAQGLRAGLPVLVAPSNVDADKYGSITGRLKSLSSVSVANTSAVGILGVKALADQTFAENDLMFMGTVTLDLSSTNSGYKWNNSAGPPYRIPISTPAEITIIAENIRPVSLILPWLNSFTRFKNV